MTTASVAPETQPEAHADARRGLKALAAVVMCLALLVTVTVVKHARRGTIALGSSPEAAPVTVLGLDVRRQAPHVVAVPAVAQVAAAPPPADALASASAGAAAASVVGSSAPPGAPSSAPRQPAPAPAGRSDGKARPASPPSGHDHGPGRGLACRGLPARATRPTRTARSTTSPAGHNQRAQCACHRQLHGRPGTAQRRTAGHVRVVGRRRRRPPPRLRRQLRGREHRQRGVPGPLRSQPQRSRGCQLRGREHRQRGVPGPLRSQPQRSRGAPPLLQPHLSAGGHLQGRPQGLLERRLRSGAGAVGDERAHAPGGSNRRRPGHPRDPRPDDSALSVWQSGSEYRTRKGAG